MTAQPLGGPLGLRGPAFAFRHDPFAGDPDAALLHWPDALVVMRDGLVAALGEHAAERPRHAADLPVHHYPDALIGAGFVDAHVHYAQMEMTGATGETLLDWLRRYTYPTEARFADPAHAARVAAIFLRALLRAGTTTACVYATVHEHAADALFAEAARLGLRIACGKVLMDRNAPEALLDGADHGIPATRRLIARWHGRGRLLYAITPRFAPACTAAALEDAGRLWRENPGTLVQTHLCETEAEIDWVRELFPAAPSYLGVYARAGLAGPGAVMGHAVHVTGGDLAALRDSGCGVAHCPSSNLFLGSGLFGLHAAKAAGVRTGLGSDVGAGTGLSALRTLNDAYKVARLRGARLHPAQAFWLATRGGAEAMRLEGRVGTLAPGMEADLVVLNPRATPELALRTERTTDLADTLAALIALGDDRAVQATYAGGRLAYARDSS